MMIPDLIYNVIIWLEEIILTIMEEAVFVYFEASLPGRSVTTLYFKQCFLSENFIQNKKG